MSPNFLRSILILPVNVRKFVEKAHTRGADAVMLDLEDSIPPGEKANARDQLKMAIPMAGKGGDQVQVRINNDPELLEADVNASIQKGLDCLVLPKAETAEDVCFLDDRISMIERERGLKTGKIKLSLFVETPKGMLNMSEIAQASERTESMIVGADDYCLELGVEPSPAGEELFVLVSTMVAVCKAHGLKPIGQLGSVADFSDLQGFEKSARRARQLGCDGGFCIHPDQVPILNRVFSPDPDKVQQAYRVKEAFEAGLTEGRASVSLDGKMVDMPIYKRAIMILEKAAAIDRMEKRKIEVLTGK